MQSDSEARLILEVAESAGRVVDRKLVAHIIDHHLPQPRRGPLQAAPYAARHITDVECAQMLEAVETEGSDERELAVRFGHPPSLIARELAAYKRRYDRWIWQYAESA